MVMMVVGGGGGRGCRSNWGGFGTQSVQGIHIILGNNPPHSVASLVGLFAQRIHHLRPLSPSDLRRYIYLLSQWQPCLSLRTRSPLLPRIRMSLKQIFLKYFIQSQRLHIKIFSRLIVQRCPVVITSKPYRAFSIDRHITSVQGYLLVIKIQLLLQKS